MSDHVAVDATKGGTETFYVLGVAIEVDDRESFEQHYFDVLAEFFDHYDLHSPFPVIKTADITNRLPSYKIGSGLDWLASKLVSNPHIERITVTFGWYDESVELDPGNEMRGIQFASNFLHQYFPIVTLRWHHHENDGLVPEQALVDNVTGRITDSWNTVGNEFDLDIVPNGDRTYPSISTADIVASRIRSVLPADAPLDDYRKIAFQWLKRNTSDDDEPYLYTESVDEADEELIVPDHPYNIHSELHYPHPVVFIRDTVLNDTEETVLQSLEFYEDAARYAYENDGCLCRLDVNQWPFTARDGDIVVHTSEEPDPKLRELSRLSSADVSLYSADSFAAEHGEE